MSGRDERLYEVLAELYRPEDLPMVAERAGISPTRLDLSGAAGARWFSLVGEAKAAGCLPKLLLCACDDLPRQAPRLSVAYNREVDGKDALSDWEVNLGRDRQRDAVADAIDWNNRSPVIALFLTGGQKQGHRHFAAWVRSLRTDRRPTVTCTWPQNDPNPDRCAARAVKRLYDAAGVAGFCKPVPHALSDWPAWTPEFAEALLRAWIIRDEPTVDTLALVYHSVPDAKPDDAVAVERYLELAWSPLAAAIERRGQPGLRAVALFEVERNDAALIEAFKAAAGRVGGGVHAPPLDALASLTPPEIAAWLGRHREPRLHREARGDRRAPASLARAAHDDTDGVYEHVLQYFSPR